MLTRCDQSKELGGEHEPVKIMMEKPDQDCDTLDMIIIKGFVKLNKASLRYITYNQVVIILNFLSTID